jgi:hypothetical protein
MIETSDLAQIGLSLEGKERLDRLRDDGYFNELRDAYRFAVAFALAKGGTPSEIQSTRRTMFAIATVDPDGTLATAIGELLPCNEVAPYRWAERLAEAGSKMITDIEKDRGFDLGAMLAEADLPEIEEATQQ